jgi:hypothetical protein
MQQPPPSSPPTEPLPTPKEKPVSPPLTKSPTSSTSILQYQQLQQFNNNTDHRNGKTHYGIAAPKRNTISYQQSCIVRPIPTSILFGALCTAYITLMQQMRKPSSSSRRDQHQQRNSTTAATATSSTLLRTFGSSVGVVYVYYAIQCPMEAIHNKESYIHNGISAFTLSYIGLAQQRIGVPLISAYTIYQLPLLARNILGASIYSCMAMTFAAFYGHKAY